MTMISGTLISISAYSWFSMWLGLEINLISVIPLFKKTKNMFSSESTIKYFVTQALASAVILFTVILFSLHSEMLLVNMNKALNLMLNSALLTKMGAAPFHFWFPEVMEGLNWNNCFILLTWQKIAPLILVMYNSDLSMFFLIIIISSMLIGGIMGLNQISMRKILAYSSINHIGWMIAAIFNSQSIWMIYFIIYTLITLNIILMLKMLNIFFLKQLFYSLNNKMMLKLFFMMNFLSLGGLPPFLGFLPKWLTVNFMINSKFYFLAFTMIILTLITLFYYMRITFSSIILNSKSILIPNLKFKTFWILSTNMISIMGLALYTLVFNFY
uniref:NADH-ubiquinone oxidoreductase chain 2 n=1 Tax=Byturus ochraceus TaxID=153018 RepID=A0A343A3P7_9CUCU|nr:NADH dehydrogenase subunit 2 [Byturus ochraceus]AOY39175.1 NADH dehydrogenase subunit 2 [Byturus ochraceus]